VIDRRGVMLIRNEKDAQGADLVSIRRACAYCMRELNYPVIMADDYNHNCYHATCAAQLAMDILGDMAEVVKLYHPRPVSASVE